MSSERALVEAYPQPAVRILPRRRRVETGLLALLAAFIAVASMVIGYQRTARAVALVLDGRALQVRTHQNTVGALLADMGIALWPEDIIEPALDTPLSDVTRITLRRARDITLVVDGRPTTTRTHAASPAAVLLDAGVTLGPYDRITVNGQTWDPPQRPFDPTRNVEIQVQRAVPFNLNDDGLVTQLWTTASTVGEALAERGIRVYLADAISVPLDTPMSPGLRVFIQRSRPVTIYVDGRQVHTRSRATTVGDLLAQEGITLRRLDYTVPATDSLLSRVDRVEVRRVDEKFVYETRPIPFETVWKADPDLEIDQRRVIQPGKRGRRKRRTRIVYENGQEVSRETANWWVEEPPTPQIIAYGTRIVWRTVDTPEGPRRYWRKLRVLATSYSAATSGKSRDHPAYGITRLGWEARRGVVAVDPKVINLRQPLYVPGYGLGVAGDTGGKIRGLHIDLGFDEWSLELWYRWVDVYLLEPAPPADRIHYVLPDWPRERR